MVFYYLMWLFISAFNLTSARHVISRLMFFLVVFILFLMTALRYEIGGDWTNYLTLYAFFKDVDLVEALQLTDPGYGIFNYISQQMGISDTILVNTLCSLVFYLCLYKICQRFQYYWLPLLIAYPYLIVVVSMGYTRQSVAITLSMLALVYALEKKNIYFFIYIVLAFLFHKSAILVLIFLPFFFVNHFFNKSMILFIYAFFSFLMISVVVYYSSISGDNIYTDQGSGVSSAGALFRVVVHFMTLVFYLIYRSTLKKNYPSLIRFFDYMSLLVIYVFFLAIVFSTLADRFNLYLISYDIFVLALLAPILATFNRYFIIGSLIFFNSIMLIIWLNFGAWSHAWLPYQSYLSNFISGAI